MSALRAFFAALFGVLGALIGLGLIIIALVWAYSKTSDEGSFSSNVKILPDENGSRKELASSTPVILQINFDGQIGSDKLTGKKIQEILLDSREEDFKNNRVKAILLAINSPGGSVIDSDIIYNSLKEYKKRYGVPIFAYVNGLCASGGYYIACSADKIFASDVSLVGSIGVISWPPFFNIYDTLEKIGANTLTISAGKGKDELNPFRPWKNEESKNYKHLIEYYYNSFVDLVSSSRNIEREKLLEVYGAEIFPAPQAQEYNLIDASGSSRESVLKSLAETAGLEKYQVVGFDTKSWWKKMVNEENSPVNTGKFTHELRLPTNKSFPFSFSFQS